jgi:hypothetical protein
LTCAWEQAEAVRLYAEEVYPDMVARHKVERAKRNSAAATYNARFAAAIDKTFKESFGPDGAKLDARLNITLNRSKHVLVVGPFPGAVN